MRRDELKIYQYIYHNTKETQKELEQGEVERAVELIEEKQKLIDKLEGFNLVEEVKDDNVLDALEDLLKKTRAIEEKNIKMLEEKKKLIAKEISRIKEGKKKQQTYATGYVNKPGGGRIIDRKS